MDEGYDPLCGARPLRRTIQREIEDPLSTAVLQGRFKSGDSVCAEMRMGEIVFRRRHGDKSPQRLRRPDEGAGQPKEPRRGRPRLIEEPVKTADSS